MPTIVRGELLGVQVNIVRSEQVNPIGQHCSCADRSIYVRSIDSALYRDECSTETSALRALQRRVLCKDGRTSALQRRVPYRDECSTETSALQRRVLYRDECFTETSARAHNINTYGLPCRILCVSSQRSRLRGSCTVCCSEQR